ncbi:MAG: DUF5320 domain-containing protein [Deltaproteobacteria bacterium]|nr:DUF5320 domain-containing protein [Deltaproteobacteria bacterium]MBW2123119.1 DUF5320 domain-containing protein [Deltaproteobacteria bacterium]
MPFGLGPLGWGFLYGYPHIWNPYWYGRQPWYPLWGPTWPYMTKEEEAAVLEDQARALEEQLKAVKQRLDELKK